MAFDAQPSPLEARPVTTSLGARAARGRAAAVRPSARAALRRRFDEAALAAAIRELRTHRQPRAAG